MHRSNWMTSDSCVLFLRHIPLTQMATEPLTIALTGFILVWFEQVTRQACSLYLKILLIIVYCEQRSGFTICLFWLQILINQDTKTYLAISCVNMEFIT
jgi:hypothetical protein